MSCIDLKYPESADVILETCTEFAAREGNIDVDKYISDFKKYS
jgi:hypothetical protein